MKKSVIFTVLAVLFVFGTVSILAAADKGNNRKGKYLFRKECRSCHQEGGSAKELSPIDKTQSDWEKVFAGDAYKNLACKAEWDKRSGEDLSDIYAYMYDHAFDSPSPAKCK